MMQSSQKPRRGFTARCPDDQLKEELQIHYTPSGVYDHLSGSPLCHPLAAVARYGADGT